MNYLMAKSYRSLKMNVVAMNFVAINCGDYFKSTREKLYSKLSKKQNLRKVAESLYIFLSTSFEV